MLIEFYRFPKIPSQRQFWIAATDRSEEPGKAAVICILETTILIAQQKKPN